MPSTHTSLHYHVVFGTKQREPWFPPSVRPKVHEYIGGIVRGMEGVAHAVGGVGDHIHVLMGLSQNHLLADVMRDLKANSSKWLKCEFSYAGFA